MCGIGDFNSISLNWSLSKKTFTIFQRRFDGNWLFTLIPFFVYYWRCRFIRLTFVFITFKGLFNYSAIRLFIYLQQVFLFVSRFIPWSWHKLFRHLGVLTSIAIPWHASSCSTAATLPRAQERCKGVWPDASFALTCAPFCTSNSTQLRCSLSSSWSVSFSFSEWFSFWWFSFCCIETTLIPMLTALYFVTSPAPETIHY